VRSLTLAFLWITGTAGALAACADDPATGAASPCDTPAGPLLSCPGEDVSPTPLTIEGACARLVDCGLVKVDDTDDQGNHHDDYKACVNGLRGDEFPAERLAFVLECVDVSTCDQLAQGHCGAFGGDAP
jgi:hypothetical protein